MLMSFAAHPDRPRVYVNGRVPHPDGDHTDLANVLYPGDAYRGLSYAVLRAAGNGVLHVDDVTGACEILRRDDPRLHPDTTHDGGPRRYGRRR